VKKITVFLPIFLLIPFLNVFAVFRQVQGLEDAYIKRVAVSKIEPDWICVASKNSLYESHDGGKNFQKTAVFKDEEVQHLFFDPYLADRFYVVTSRHFCRAKEEGLENLFSVSSEDVIYTAAKDKGFFFVGTSQGLYLAAEDELVWKKSRILSDSSIYYVEPAAEGVYLAVDKGVYFFSKDKSSVQRLFVTRKEEDEAAESLIPAVIKVDIFDNNNVLLGTSKGLFISDNKGAGWKKAAAAGIDSLSINCIVQTDLQSNAVYVGSAEGFFIVNLDKGTSKQIFEGLSSSAIWWAEFSSKGNIYLATSRGLFKNNYFTASYKSTSLKKILANEPSIEEVQQISLKYNEVHPDKIRKWRNAVKYKALFPEISLDFDKTVTTALGASYDRVQVGPQDWGINLKWDVGDLVWNSSETSIDNRSKLNTQLRLDILDEINRVYFERLRLKGEIAASSLGEEELFAKELRLRELTAIIDGYTGGFFSQRIKECYGQ